MFLILTQIICFVCLQVDSNGKQQVRLVISPWLFSLLFDFFLSSPGEFNSQWEMPRARWMCRPKWGLTEVEYLGEECQIWSCWKLAEIYSFFSVTCKGDGMFQIIVKSVDIKLLGLKHLRFWTCHLNSFTVHFYQNRKKAWLIRGLVLFWVDQRNYSSERDHSSGRRDDQGHDF